VKDWQGGDVEAIAALENSDMREKYPVLYSTLLAERNRRWARQIAQLLQPQPQQSIFIAVGAAHLAGPDDVQTQLQKLGIHVERVH
jgi:hypothetical protein